MHKALLPLLLLLLTTPALASEPAAPPKAARTQRINLIVAGNTEGHFADVDCRNDPILAPYWARQVAYFHTLDDIAALGNLPHPITIHAGDALFPGTLARFLLEQEGGPAAISQLLSRLSLSVLAMGNQEFALERGAFIDLIEAAQQAGIQVQAQNLRCEGFGPAEALCAAINQPTDEQEAALPYRIVERGGIRFAITSALAPGLIDSLDGPQKEGLRILDPTQALPKTLKSMRDSADLAIVLLHTDSDDSYQAAYDLAQQVEGIDLIIASQFFEPQDEEEPLEEGPMAVLRAQRTNTPIVSGNSGAHSLLNLELTVVSNPKDSTYRLQDLSARRVATDHFPPHRETAAILEEQAAQLCQDWGQALGDNARLASPFDFQEMQLFILNVMRFSTRSEVALMNTGAFRNEEHFPIESALSAADIYAILPFENQLMTASIKGSKLQEIAPKISSTLRAAGLTIKDDKPLINGRPIAPERRYTIAINDFLARGGDGFFAPEDLTELKPYQPPYQEGQTALDELIIRYIQTGQQTRKQATPGYLSATANFPDLHRRNLWTFLGSLNASYNQVTVQNPAHNGLTGYDHSQLTVDSADQINLEGRLSAQADSRDHRFNNDLNLQYATTRLNEDAGFEETKDLIRFRSTYRNQRLRAMQGGQWFIPDPLIEGQLETEFTRPDSRSWHRLDLRGILGLSFQLFAPLDLRLGTNVRQDINQPDGRPTWGINAGFNLRRIDLAKFLGRPIQFESEAEYFYNDIAGDNIHELRSANRLFFAVFDQFFFTASFNLFFFQNDLIGLPGTNREFMLGLNYQWDAALQRF